MKQWKKLDDEWIKINCYGAFCPWFRKASFGVMARDYQGMLVNAIEGKVKVGSTLTI